MKKHKKRPQIDRSLRRPAPRSTGGIQLVTPEGTPLVFASARYRHADPEGIRHVLGAAEDFDTPGPEEMGQAQQTFGWLQTEPIPGVSDPAVGYRVLASLTLTPATLEVEAMSEQRLANCRKRLETLLGDRIRLEETSTRSAAQALSERVPRAEPPDEPFMPPPEVLAQIEEQLLRKWISEPIPALGGLTPLEAVKTSAGRRRVIELIEEGERMQRVYGHGPGFAPDYRKTKKMLGLE
jgi:hypothetical protein